MQAVSKTTQSFNILIITHMDVLQTGPMTQFTESLPTRLSVCLFTDFIFIILCDVDMTGSALMSLFSLFVHWLHFHHSLWCWHDSLCVDVIVFIVCSLTSFSSFSVMLTWQIVRWCHCFYCLFTDFIFIILCDVDMTGSALMSLFSLFVHWLHFIILCDVDMTDCALMSLFSLFVHWLHFIILCDVDMTGSALMSLFSLFVHWLHFHHSLWCWHDSLCVDVIVFVAFFTFLVCLNTGC